jgi:hypothetical protein
MWRKHEPPCQVRAHGPGKSGFISLLGRPFGRMFVKMAARSQDARPISYDDPVANRIELWRIASRTNFLVV